MTRLLTHLWPGRVCELWNVLERAVVRPERVAAQGAAGVAPTPSSEVLTPVWAITFRAT